MTIISTAVVKNPLKEMDQPSDNKGLWNAVLGGNLKNEQNDLCSFPRQTIQYHSNPSLRPNH